MPEPMVDPYLSGVIQDLQKQEIQSQQLYTSLSNGVTLDPAAESSHQRTARALGTTPDTVRVDPKRYEAVAKMRGFDAQAFTNQWPVTTNIMSNPDNAAAAHDDLETYKAAEDQFKAAEAKGWLTGWTPSQRSALAESLISQADYNKGRDQITSAAASINKAAVTPFLSFVGSLAKAPEELLNKAFGTQSNPNDPSIGGSVDSITKAFDEWTGANIKQGAQPQLWDPQQKKWFANPLYGHGGQNLVNEVTSMPGTLAAMWAGGSLTAPIMAFNAGYGRFNDVLAKTGSPWKALAEGWGSGAANLALLTKMPAPIPQKSLGATVAMQTARAVPLAGGMTVIDNTLRQLHEPDGDLTKDFTRQLITFALFENVHSINVAVGKAGEAYGNYKFMSEMKDAVEKSKLFERDPQLFAEHLSKMGEGKDVSIDARTWTRYWQLQGEDPAAKAETFGVDPAHYAEANATANEMFIPVSKFLTETAKTPHFEELAKDVRLKPGGVTMRESEAMAQQLESEVNLAQAELQKMAAQDRSEHPDYQKLVEDFKVQAIGAGGDTTKTAPEAAKLFANVAINLADKASSGSKKVSPFDIAKRLVVGPDTVVAGDTNGIHTQPDPRLAGSGNVEGSSRLRQDQTVGFALGAGIRPADARSAFQRLGDIHAEIAASELPWQAARLLDPVRFDSREHGQREYTREVVGRNILVADTRYEGDPRGRGGIDLSVLKNGDLFVNHIFNDDVLGAGKFLYDQSVQLALQHFPEVNANSHLIGSTSEDAIASRLSYNGTDVYRPETDGISWVGGITSTRVQDVLNHGRPADLLGPDGGVTRFNQPSKAAEDWSTNRSQLRSARQIVQSLADGASFAAFKTAMKIKLGKDYSSVAKGVEFGGEKGDKALRLIYEKAQEKELSGAPSTVRNEADRSALVDKLVGMAKTGESGRFWYDDSGKAFLDLANGDRLQAFKLATLTALYSPQTSVADNGRRAILAYYDAMHNMTISAGGVHPNVKELAQRVMSAKTLEEAQAVMSGQKTSAFQQNLINLFAPEHANDDMATIDLHMMRAYGYDTEAPTGVQYKWAEQITRDVADALGWGSPKEAQAAIWTAQKMVTDNKGKGSEAKQAGFHYGDAVKKIAGNVNVEAMPGESMRNAIFPGIGNATDAQLNQYHAEKMTIVSDALKQAGVLVSGESLGHGYWEGKSNPVTAFHIPLPHIGTEGDHVIAPSGVAEIKRAARIVLDLVGDQDAIGWSKPFVTSKVSEANGVHFALDRSLTVEEMRTLGDDLAKAGLDAFIDASDPRNIKVLNYNWDGVLSGAAGSQAAKVAKEYHAKVKDLIGKALPADMKVDANEFYAQTGLVEKGATDGNNQLTGDAASGTPAVQAGGLSDGRAKIEALNERYRTEFGWGSDGLGASSGGDLPQLASGAAEGRSAHGIHFSTLTDATSLRSDFRNGTASGETTRLKDAAADPEFQVITQRKQFYEKTGEGLPQKERVVVGNTPYEAMLHGLLDTTTPEAQAIWQKAREQADNAVGAGAYPQNQFEKLVVGAGYNGYLTVDGSGRNVITVLGHEAVPARPVEMLRLNQPDANSPRGFLEFDSGKETFRIGITENQNKSTIFHELTHFFVEVTGKLAGEVGAGDEIVKLNADLRKWVGAEEGKPLTEIQHEKLADGMLLYLAEGKAPAPELKSTFRKIAGWFGKIGQQLISADVKLDPEVRGIFDRMIASDKAIDEAKMLMGDASPLFVTAAAMGVTEKEFHIYLAAKQKDIDAAKEELRSQLMRQLQREHAQEWRDQLAVTREKLAAELDAMPEYKALKALTTGEMEDGTPIKLSREALVEQYGAERLKELGRSRDLVYSATEGMDAESAALLLGFKSGDELVTALTGLEARGKRIARESVERMKAEHGDLLTDPQAFREASLVAYNEQREDVLASELKALNKLKRTAEGVAKPRVAEAKAEGKAAVAATEAEAKAQADAAAQADTAARKAAAADVPNMQAARIAASAFVGNTPLFRTDPNRYRQASEKASREAFDKQGKGDYAGAVEAKRTEILNHFMFLEAQRALKLGDKTLEFAKNLQTTRTYGNLGKAGGTFQQQIDQLLERFEFKKGTNQQLADRETLAQWVEKMTADNEEAVVPDWIQNELLRTNYRQLTNNQVQDVLDTMKNIKHLAYRQLRVDTGVRKVEFTDLLSEMDDRARANNKSTPLPLPDSTVSAKQKVINFLRGKDAALVKMEQMINWLDGNDVNGPWHEAIWNPLSRAQTADYDKIVEINQKLQAHLEQMPRKQQDSMLDEFTVPGFEHKLNRKQIITMLFNTGTAANKVKLIGGYIKEGLSEEVLNAAFKNLNQHDTAFVQGVWDTIGDLWPEIAALQKRMSGIEPKREEVTPVTVTHSDGSTQELRGGYFPLVAAAGRSTVAGKQESSATALFDYGGGYTKAATSTGHTKERTGAIYPLSLDFTPTLTQHTTQVIKDLTHREAVVLANRILTNPKVRTTLAEVMGEDYRDQFMPWLRNIVNDRNGAASQAASKWQTFATSSRANLVAAVLGFKFSSVIVQLTDATRVVGPGEYRVPVDKFSGAFLDFLQHPKDTIKMVHELSGEMRHRPENLDRDLRPQWDRLRGDASWKAEWNRKAFKGLGFMDALISVPAWVGAYRHAMDKGETSDNAVLMADRTVRLNLMAGNPKDLLGVQRDPDKFMKLVTMFMGDGPAQYNLLRNAGHKMDGLSGIGTFTGTAIAVSMANIIGDYLKGQKPADGEDKRKWALRKALLAWSQPIPIIRDVASAVDGKLAGKPFSDYRLSPVVTVGQKLVDGIHRVQMLAEGTEKAPDFAIHALDTIGTVYGVGGTSQFVASAKYLRRVQTGEEKPANAMELIGNTIQGKPKEMKR